MPTKFKFGDAISEPTLRPAVILYLGVNEGEPFMGGDNYEIRHGSWFGMNLREMHSKAFPVGEVSWLPETWAWEKVE